MKIEINRNGNEVKIKPDFEKKIIRTEINRKVVRGLKLNKENQFISQRKKIGVQLTPDQAEQIRTWIKEFEEITKKEDEEKIKEIENKRVQTLSIKFHNYMTEKYITADAQITLSNHKQVYSKEAVTLMTALRYLSLDELEKLGVKREDDVWSDIKLTDEIKKFILEKGASNKAKAEKEIGKIEKEKEERKAEKEQRENEEKEKALEKAIETGEKQVLSTSSAMADDGNLIIISKYVHPDGRVSTSEFHDTD